MARGWESKSVEAQIEQSNSESSDNSPDSISPEQRRLLLRRNDLMLSRKRIAQQLEDSSNDRYSELLRRTLTGLDEELARLP
jgi:hypothetical protein